MHKEVLDANTFRQTSDLAGCPDHEHDDEDPPELEECPACGDEYDPDDGPSCDCVDCYSCGELTHDEWQRTSERTGMTYCESCYSETFDYCESCDTEQWNEDIYYNERTSRHECDSCYENNQGQPAEPVRVASCCGTRNVHLNPLTERFECECKANARKRDPLAILARFPIEPERVPVAA